jgi:hypothetical protein
MLPFKPVIAILFRDFDFLVPKDLNYFTFQFLGIQPFIPA